jgi:subtilisin-like proprotein convertase family protein
MNKFLVLIAFLFVLNSNYGQNENPWKKIDVALSSIIEKNSSTKISANETLYQLDEVSFRKALYTNQADRIEITIPNINGDLEKFQIWESSNFDPELQAKYPEIRAYSGKGITDPNASINFSLSPQGIQTMVLRGEKGSEFIESVANNTSTYKLFSSKNRTTGRLPFSCKTEDKILNNSLLNKTSKTTANNQSFKTFRLALSCTAEYTTFYGGTVAGALAGMNATMTRVNGVFNNDLAVKLVLIANNDLIIYTDVATDPYSGAVAGANGAWNQELQTNLTNTIGDANYDIGHLFGASGSGGNAGCIGCICVDPTIANPLEKGSGFTSPADGNSPQGDTFDIDYVIHEMGHQLGASHTFSFELEQPPTGTQVEPGSGSTIMGYAGITDYDVQSNSDDYFSYASILEIQNNLATKSCGTSVSTLPNVRPTVNAGADWTIPKGTAFILIGTGSDPNGDSLTYCWEQNDSVITQDLNNCIAFPTKVDGPLFRSLYPSSSPIRYMPSLANVVNGKINGTWESVSSIARTLHFELTARDYATLGKGQTNTDEMIVTVSGTVGPFAVTSQNTSDISWSKGSSQTITWGVNSSNTLLGSANVNIKLSIDGGLTFPTVLASNTPNDGSEIITVPNISAMNCRILIEPTANIYYAVNSQPFAIGYTVASTCDAYTFPSTPFVIPETAVYTTRAVTVPSATGTVSDVNVSVDFEHLYLSDVQIDVMSPTGTIVKLFERNCGNSKGNRVLNYDDLGGILDCGINTLQTVIPYDALSKFNGQNPQGNWTLRVRDPYTGDTGKLNSASITICTKTFTLETSNYVIDDFVMYPNPNKGIFNIKFTSNSSEKIKVLIHDLLGRKIYDNQFDNNGNINEKIHLKKYQSWTYILTVVDGSRKVEKKIILE